MLSHRETATFFNHSQVNNFEIASINISHFLFITSIANSRFQNMNSSIIHFVKFSKLEFSHKFSFIHKLSYKVFLALEIIASLSKVS